MANLKRQGALNYIFTTIITIFIFSFIYMVIQGAINYRRNAHCQVKNVGFCGLKEIDLAVPDELNKRVRTLVDQGLGKRVNIVGWKAGRTIDTQTVIKHLPELYDWYKSIASQISKEVNETVKPTQDYLPTTCAVLVYEHDNDFINWHYDVNYFNGRFFTLLIPVTYVNTCTKYTYRDANNQIISLPIKQGKSILFEGDKVFHMASKFCAKGEKRIVISVQFSTDPGISFINRFLMRLKDTAYIGAY